MKQSKEKQLKNEKLKENDKFGDSDIYKKINKEISSWPQWKKKVYNEMFAFSSYSEKLDIYKNN